MSTIFTFLLLSSWVGSGQTKDVPFACDVSGHYTGNAINPFFRLKIDASPARSWTYSFSDDRYGLAKGTLATRKGTYEIEGNLAIFSEKLAKPGLDGAMETRFGLNFGYPQGELTFNRFFPGEVKKEGQDACTEMTYRRKWFQNKQGKWEPTEELLLTLKSPLPRGNSKNWEVTWKGKRVVWKEGGNSKTEEPIDLTLNYQQYKVDYYYIAKTPLSFWIPTDLILHGESGRVESIAVTNGCIGDLRGFHPRYGDGTKQP